MNFLGKAGVILDEAIAYQTVPETEDPTGAVKRFKEEGADIITFTSASTVECFLDLGLSIPEGCKIASIGPVTSEAVEENGYTVDLEAKDHDIPGLVEAVLKLGKGWRRSADTPVRRIGCVLFGFSFGLGLRLWLCGFSVAMSGSEGSGRWQSADEVKGGRSGTGAALIVSA